MVTPTSPCSVRASPASPGSTPQPRAPRPVQGPCLECTCSSPHHEHPSLLRHTLTAGICCGGVGSGLHLFIVLPAEIKEDMCAEWGQLNSSPRAGLWGHLSGCPSTCSPGTAPSWPSPAFPVDHTDSGWPGPETQQCDRVCGAAGAAGTGRTLVREAVQGGGFRGEGGGGYVCRADWAELQPRGVQTRKPQAPEAGAVAPGLGVPHTTL